MRVVRWKAAATALFVSVAAACLLSAPSAALAADGVQMHRLYNQWTGEHFYTASAGERDSLVSVGWTSEGVGWVAPEKSGTPVYRLYNPYVKGGDHHYTTNASERDALVRAGWRAEGTGWYSDDAKGVPLYRQYNPYATTGTHNYTADTNERDHLVSLGWHDEGVGWYGMKTSSGSGQGGSNQGGSQGGSQGGGNQGGSNQGGSETPAPPTEMNDAVDFFNYVGDAEGDGHGGAALSIIDVNNPAGINSWYIINTRTSMDGTVFPAYTHIGSTTDATYINNMYTALDIIEECNRLRALEGLPELKVSDCGMAIGMLNANWSAAYFEETGQLAHAANYGERYNWAENISWGYTDPVAAFAGWFWQEKANYTGKAVTDPDTGRTYQPVSGGQIGHYLNITNPNYTVTGAGVSMNCGQPVFAQEFKTKNTIPRPGLGGYEEGGVTEELYTVDQYRARLDRAVASVR